MTFDTIAEFEFFLCGNPRTDAKFKVYSLKREEYVYEGDWYDLLDSRWADMPLASIDLADELDTIMCFNLADEDWDYSDEEEIDEDEDYYDHDWIAGDNDEN